MTSRVASLRLQLIDSVSGPGKNVASSLKGIDSVLAKFGRSGTPAMRKLTKELEYLKKKSSAIDDFTSKRRDWKALSAELKSSQSNLQRLSQAMDSVKRPTAKMKAEMNTAKSAVKMATEAFIQQGRAVKAAEQSLRTYGLNGRRDINATQKAIRQQVTATIKDIRKLEAEMRKSKEKQPPATRPPGGGGNGRGNGGQSGSGELRDAVITGIGGYTAGKTVSVGKQSIVNAIDFSQVKDFQNALGGFSPSESAMLQRQAERIGGATRFSNPDVVNAQTVILQRGIRDVDTIMNLTDKVSEYALAMGTTLEEGAETIGGAALSKRINLKDAKAVATFVDRMVWMAKNGGMDNEDVRQYYKYGGAPSTTAGLPDDYSAAIGMTLRRSGMRGDEAGVFLRSMVSKLVAPTNKGRTALMSMGINFDDYVKMPDKLNENGLKAMLANNFGKKMTPAMQEQIAGLFDEEIQNDDGESVPLLSDAGAFTSRASDILSPLFGKKKGKMAAADAKALAKALMDFQKFSAESVDVVRLFNDIRKSDPSLISSNAFFTDKQGGRFASIAQQGQLFDDQLNLIRNTPAGIANKIGTEANSGLYGDTTRMAGTIETVLTRMGQDWEPMIRYVSRTVDKLGDAFLHLDQPTRRAAEGLGLLAGALGGFLAFKAGTKFLFGGGGGGAAAGAAEGAVAPSVLRLLAGSRGNLGMMAYMAATGALAYAFPNTDARKGAPRTYDQGEDANRANYQRMWGPAITQSNMWEGGMHRAYSGFGPKPGEGSPFGEYLSLSKAAGEQAKQNLSVTATPQVDTSSIQRGLSLVNMLRSAMQGLSGGGGAAPPPGDSSKFGGRRAAGGRVRKGRTYLVGERGPEPFTPGADGYITPNHAMNAGSGGGGPVIHITNHFHGKAEPDDAVQKIGRGLNRLAQTTFTGLKFAGDT